MSDGARCFYCKKAPCECKELCRYCGYALPEHNGVCIQAERDELRSQNAALRERNAELEAAIKVDNTALEQERDRALSELAEKTRDRQETCAREGILTLQLAEARKDTERLDRLQVQIGPDFEWTMQRLDSGGHVPMPIRIGYYDHDIHYKTVREAIDAAIGTDDDLIPRERDVKSPVSGADQ